MQENVTHCARKRVRNEGHEPLLVRYRMPHTSYRAQRGACVKRKPKPLARRTAQLEGALALFGGRNEVAGYDKSVFVRRAGELIARAVMNGKRMPAVKRGDHS